MGSMLVVAGSRGVACWSCRGHRDVALPRGLGDHARARRSSLIILEVDPPRRPDRPRQPARPHDPRVQRQRRRRHRAGLRMHHARRSIDTVHGRHTRQRVAPAVLHVMSRATIANLLTSRSSAKAPLDRRADSLLSDCRARLTRLRGPPCAQLVLLGAMERTPLPRSTRPRPTANWTAQPAGLQSTMTTGTPRDSQSRRRASPWGVSPADSPMTPMPRISHPSSPRWSTAVPSRCMSGPETRSRRHAAEPRRRPEFRPDAGHARLRRSGELRCKWRPEDRRPTSALQTSKVSAT